MRAGRSSLALTTLALCCPLACATYSDDSLRIGDGLDNTAGTGAAGDSAKAGAGSGPGSAGSDAKAGSFSVSAGAGGTSPTTGGNGELAAGGDSSAEGGEPAGGAPGGGKGNAGGSGKGGSGGTSAGSSAGGKGGTSSGNGGVGGTTGASGAAGTAGGPSVPKCSDHPLSARSSWLASASHSDSAGLPANLLDGKITRWSTGKAQSGDEWLQIDLGATATLNHVNLQQGDYTNDYPRTYSVIVSHTAKNVTGSVLVTGSGKSGTSTAISLPALASGRYLLLKQTGSSLSWWSVEEIEVSCSD